MPNRRESYISSKLGSITERLQQLFDEIGLSRNERDSRERELYSVISDALEKHVQAVNKERDSIYNECLELQGSLRSMINSLKDLNMTLILGTKEKVARADIRPPFKNAYAELEDAHNQIETIYSERLVRVNKALEILKELAAKVDGVAIPQELLPAQEDQVDLSNSRIIELEQEIKRWQDEYRSRISTVAKLASQTVALWAELGTSQENIDRNILSCYKNSPEKLGTMTSDLNRINNIYNELQQEKESREQKLMIYKSEIKHLWAKLNEDHEHVNAFEKSNLGLGLAVLEAYQRELERLHVKKRQHIHVFIQDARTILRELWDKLYYSEQEMLEFTPAWTEIYTDASLDAHESEIARLEAILEEQKPILTLIDNYQSLKRDAEALEASTLDSSRLLAKAGTRRDPTRLLREEQMRKRLARRKPKVIEDLKAALEKYEINTGKSFLVNGRNFYEVLEEEEVNTASKTPRRRLDQTINLSPLKAIVKPPANQIPPSSTRSRTQQTAPSLVRHASTNSRIRKHPPQPSFNSLKRTVTQPTTISSSSSSSGYTSELRIAKSRANTQLLPLPLDTPVRRLNALNGAQDSILKPSSSPAKGKENVNINPVYAKPMSKSVDIRIPSTVSMTASIASSENWESYDDDSSSEDEAYKNWRQEAIRKLATSNTINNGNKEQAFSWDKDTF
jgi:hypothetical protein